MWSWGYLGGELRYNEEEAAITVAKAIFRGLQVPVGLAWHVLEYRGCL